MNSEGFPCLEAVQQKYKDKGVVVLVANGIESTETIANYAGKKVWTFNYLARKERDMLPERLYGMVYQDGVFVIGKDGKVAWNRNLFDGTVEQPLLKQVEQELAK